MIAGFRFLKKLILQGYFPVFFIYVMLSYFTMYDEAGDLAVHFYTFFVS